MRAAAVAALLVGAVVAHDSHETTTDYTTLTSTISSCPETVTDCPAHSTTVVSTTYPLTTSTVYQTTTSTITACPSTKTDCPLGHVTTVVVPVSTTVCPVTTSKAYPNSTITYVHPTGTTSTPCPEETTLTTKAPQCPTTSVKTIHTSYTTVIPTVIYETVAVPCPTSVPTGSNPGCPGGASCPGGNGTTPKPTSVVTAGAGSLTGSVVVAAAAGVLALIFA